MNKFRLVALIVIIAALSFLAGSRFHQKSSPPDASAQSRHVLYYIDPMHPAYKSDKPGIAPDCGMELEPVYAEGVADVLTKYPIGTVNITGDKQQLIGVRVAAVEGTPAKRALRLLGRVAADEGRLYFLNAATDGWVQETFSNSTGSLVKKDEILATCYAPEFRAAEQAYFYALGALDRFQASGKETAEQIAMTQINVKQAADGLRNLGMGEVQIQALARGRQYTESIEIRSPATGFILERNVARGLRFERGKQLYRIADLSRVWILADVFQNDTQYFRPGTRVRATLPNQRKSFIATVSDVPPTFDPVTRTLKLRLEADNPGLTLRPDMFVDVELPVTLPSGISVPMDAVLDTGVHKTVFVEVSDGVFEPRVVETGWRFGGRIQIVRGLAAGERVVVSGNFLVDSESRLKAAAAGIYSEAVKDPVCGMTIDQGKATATGRKLAYRGTTYYFCSDQCRGDFEKDPARYAGKSAITPMAVALKTNIKQAKPETGAATDVVCGMSVDVKKAVAAGLKSEYRGVTYYFCSPGCKRNFDKAPESYLKKSHDSARLSSASAPGGGADE